MTTPATPPPHPATLRVSALGSDPAAVLAVVEFFDALDETSASPDALVKSAARLAECPISVRWASGSVLRYDAQGHRDGDDRPMPASEDDLEVTVHRDGAAHPLDSVIVERLTRQLHRCGRTTALHLGDPALVEIVLSSKEHREDRARAIRLLGLDETRELRVLAVSSHSPADTVKLVVGELAGLRVHTAAIGHTIAVLCQGSSDVRTLTDALDAAIITAFPAPVAADADRGPWVGVGSSTGVLAAYQSWHQALRALRFASSTGYGRRAIAYERLSALELLADLPAERVLANQDVVRINQIASTPAGALDVSTVEAFCVFGSLRRTAEELHVHHSTVAARLAHVATQMGWDFDDPMDRFMATLVLMMRRISLSAAALAEADSP